MTTFSHRFSRAKKKFSSYLSRFFKKKRTRIGIYGPPNAGKTTLANRIARDWTGDAVGPVSEIPHETRRARKKENVVISGANGSTITIDIVDTPGVTTRIDYHEFLEYGMEKDEAIIRAREATEGVAEAMHWLREDINGVVYMLDSTLDPFMQVNIMMIGIIESRKLPVIIVANKIDLPDAVPNRIRSAFPQHPVVAISGLEGRNTEELYEKMIENFA
jgi:GTPase